jgi:hypothetical protein
MSDCAEDLVVLCDQFGDAAAIHRGSCSPLPREAFDRQEQQISPEMNRENIRYFLFKYWSETILPGL